MVSSLIASIRGTLEGAGPNWADVSVGGVTFRVAVPISTAERLGPIGDRVHLLTSLQVRADSLTLYGFLTEEARQAFEALLGVNGVGPKVALSVLSRLTPQELVSAVRSGDTRAFKGAPGVGDKTASRIVLELKGKLEGVWAVPAEVSGDGEVLDALTALGYTMTEARKAVASLPSRDALSLEDKVRLALEGMGRR